MGTSLRRANAIAARLVSDPGWDVPGRYDFVLAFWMVHEVPDRPRFLGELAALLRPGGLLLVAEPILHVPAREVERTFDLARAAGLELLDRPRVALSRAGLFRRPG